MSIVLPHHKKPYLGPDNKLIYHKLSIRSDVDSNRRHSHNRAMPCLGNAIYNPQHVCANVNHKDLLAPVANNCDLLRQQPLFSCHAQETGCRHLSFNSMSCSMTCNKSFYVVSSLKTISLEWVGLGVLQHSSCSVPANSRKCQDQQKIKIIKYSTAWKGQQFGINSCSPKTFDIFIRPKSLW